MQLYALDESNTPVAISQAEKQKNYICLECGSRVRSRSGEARQPHFYHLEPPKTCTQHQKGVIHLQTQFFIQALLPANECQLEYPFKSIGRIADAAWLPQKVVFEIQYSPITPKEVEERKRDYERAGWHLIWILHEQQFNRHRRPLFLDALFKNQPFYFTDMNEKGKGKIYDQFSVWEGRRRREKLPPLKVDLASLYPISSYPLKSTPSLELIERRCASWPYFFGGDLLDLSVREPDSPYLVHARLREESNSKRQALPIWKKAWACMKTGYTVLFEALMERINR